MRDQILSQLSQFDAPEPEWCLPPQFWERAVPMTGYTALLLGRRLDMPHRQCHFSAIQVYRAGQSVKECSLEMVTGYAYSSEKWFRHTWVRNPPDKTLLECTPTQFEGYLGVVLTSLESQQFAEILGYDTRNSGVINALMGIKHMGRSLWHLS